MAQDKHIMPYFYTYLLLFANFIGFDVPSTVEYHVFT